MLTGPPSRRMEAVVGGSVTRRGRGVALDTRIDWKALSRRIGGSLASMKIGTSQGAA